MPFCRGLNETLVEAKMFTITIECMHFIFNKCPIWTHDGANVKFSTRCDETDYSAAGHIFRFVLLQQLTVFSSSQMLSFVKKYSTRGREEGRKGL